MSQPYFTLNGVDDGFDPSKTPGYPSGIAEGASYLGKQSHIARNFIINGYNGVWAIDHDDGSQRYNDTANLMVFGGCKNFLGNSKSCDHNVILYPGIDSRSSGGPCSTDSTHTSLSVLANIADRCSNHCKHIIYWPALCRPLAL